MRGGLPALPLTRAARWPRHPSGSGGPRKKPPRKRVMTAQRRNRPSSCWRTPSSSLPQGPCSHGTHSPSRTFPLNSQGSAQMAYKPLSYQLY
uniref:Uncharacterized protein n=1 Tax=Mustela putorius furo TaxID=9669 RepID=M3YTE4_MUSPF